jgi:hypothetical protein
VGICAFLLALGVLGFGASAAIAAPPPNDNFANGADLTADFDTAGTNLEATAEAGEPNPDSAAFDFDNDDCGVVFDADCSASVWYDWTAPSAGAFTFHTCNSEIDTVVGVYTGAAVNALTPAGPDAENDDTDCGTTGLGSVVSFNATAGAQFHILVAGFDAEEGNFLLSSGAVPPPATPPAVTPGPTLAPPVIAQQTGKGKKGKGKKKCGKKKGGKKGEGKNNRATASKKKCGKKGGHKGGHGGSNK